MRAKLRIAALAGLVAWLAALPAAADIFVVRLVNGTTFETRYQPRPAPWDAGKIVFLSDLGNWVALLQSEVAAVESLRDLRGFGRILDTTTIELGLSPNDLTDEEIARREQVPEVIPQRFDMQQFVEPDAVGGGIPVWSTGGAGGGPPVPGAPLIPPTPPVAAPPPPAPDSFD
jgi:hypothetical protein